MNFESPLTERCMAPSSAAGNPEDPYTEPISYAFGPFVSCARVRSIRGDLVHIYHDVGRVIITKTPEFVVNNWKTAMRKIYKTTLEDNFTLRAVLINGDSHEAKYL